jgi:SAM-dependent methyltransferase
VKPSPESPTSWNEVAGGWERRRAYVWDVTRPVSDRLVALLDPRPGETVLELAAGPGDTGFLAAELVGRTGRLLSTDVAPEMVAAARRRAAELGLENVEFRQENAQALDLPDGSVDGALCRWGYMLVDEPARAFAETRRVLRPGGRVAFAVWASPDENPWASATGRVLLERGLVERPEPNAPGPFRLADPNALRALVTGTGLELVTVEDVAVLWRHDDFEGYWETSRDLSRTLAVALGQLEPDGVAEVREAVQAALADYDDGDGLAVPGLTRVALARRG